MANELDALISVLEKMKNSGIPTVPISPENLDFLEHYSPSRTESAPVSHCPPRDVPPKNSEENGGSQTKNYSPTEIPTIAFHGPQKKIFSSKQEHWEDLRRRVLENETLKKHVRPGKNLVFGVGNLDAKIFFCGEAPGADEEIQGLPFVGRAGQLLTKIIAAMGLTREDVYIGNIMNWRPEMDTDTGNRPPTQEEMQHCLPHLIEQVQIVKPEAIVALGATAVSGLLGYDRGRKMSSVRGNWHEFCGIPLMITFHPSYLLRNGTNRMKRVVWEDMMKVMERVGMAISERQRKYFLE
ncbi:MAG: uracil-DNA glycosylase [Puniceicoccales bacterium]|jgi:DNA polymerase|nr:uracil-DNA glycosylase [Puniceicoccales bacterium]